MQLKSIHLTIALVLMATTSAVHANDSAGADKLVFSRTKTAQFVTGVAVQMLKTDVKEGVEVYQRPDGSCYEQTSKILSYTTEETDILGISLRMPEVSTSTKEVDCVG